MDLGYVGVGNMGGALAQRLTLSHSLFVHDLSQAAVSQLVTAGATACATIAELTSKTDIIFLCLPTSAEVETVVLGPGGLRDTARPGTVIIDQTSGDPPVTRRIAAALEGTGIDLVDAPVSGGIWGAQQGTIAIMVGADEALFARVLPVLNSISPNVFHAGGLGTGHTAKLANNMLSACNRLATMEAVALAAKNGMEPRRMVEIINASGGRNLWSERFAIPMIEGKLNSNFTLGLSHKDVRQACQLGIASDVPTHFGDTARNLYMIAINDMGREVQVNAAGFTIDRIAGTHVIPDGAEKD